MNKQSIPLFRSRFIKQAYLYVTKFWRSFLPQELMIDKMEERNKLFYICNEWKQDSYECPSGSIFW